MFNEVSVIGDDCLFFCFFYICIVMTINYSVLYDIDFLKGRTFEVEENKGVLLCGPQSRARCSSSLRESVFCPGERADLETVTKMEVESLRRKGGMSGALSSRRMAAGRTADGWPECFQDLGTWCRPDPDELNTPQMSIQDEFTFSLEGQVNNSVWDIHSPVEFNNDWGQDPQILETSNIIHTVTDEENNNFELQNCHSTYGKSVLSSSQEGNLVNSNTINTINPIAYVGGSMSSGNVPLLKNRGNVLLSQCTLGNEVRGTSLFQQEDSLDNLDMKSNKLNSSIIRSSVSPKKDSVRIKVQPTIIKDESPVVQRGRPSLKLNIAAASITTPATSCTLDTPEVLRPLTDFPAGFDLLNYVCGEPEEKSLPAVIKKESDEGEISSAIQDHNYSSGSSPLSEEGGVKVKSEPDSPPQLYHFDQAHKRKNTVRTRGKRISESSEEAYTNNRSDDEEFDDDESGSDGSVWSPETSGEGRSSSSKSYGGPSPSKRRRERKTSSDTLTSFSSIEDKYRALRDRNNEASRRSRQNRKQRDAEMRKYKLELEKKNIELKVKADKMERLVKDMRAALMNAVRSKRN